MSRRSRSSNAWWERLSLGPEIALDVRRHVVVMGSGRAAVSFTTRGLAELGQPEVIFTSLGPPWLPAPSGAVSDALAAIARLVEAGSLRLASNTCIPVAEVSLIDADMSGLLFVPAQAMRGVKRPEGALHAIALTRDEIEIANRISPRRVTARLGLLTGYFPFPPWSWPRRSVARPGETTVLATSPRADVPGLSVDLDHTTLTVRVPRRSARLLGTALRVAGRAGIAILTEPAADADAHLVWMPGKPAATVFIKPRSTGQRIAGGFLRVVVGASLAAGVLEDGYSLVFDERNRDALSGALSSELDWSAPTDSGSLRVRVV